MAHHSIDWTTVSQLAAKYDSFLLDCDGVLWSGDLQIDQAFEVIQGLQAQGKKVFFISNSSGKTREDSMNKMKKFGFKDVVAEQIYGSAYITSQYIKEKYPDFAKIRVVGENSIKKELAQVGIDSVGAEDDEGYGTAMSMDEYDAYEIDRDVKAVVVGLDPRFTYTKLCLASLYIQSGAKFIATNDNAYDMVQGRKMPGAGAMVESIQITLTNAEGGQEMRRPEILGKPNPYVIDLIMRQHKIEDKTRMVMIGDRPDTDILLGFNSGIDTCLVMTGVVRNETEMDQFVEIDERVRPTYKMHSFGKTQ